MEDKKADLAGHKANMMSLDGCSTTKEDNPVEDKIKEATASTNITDGVSAPENKKLSLMSLNDNKAGMKGLDKEKINAIIENASKGSKFYAKQKENQARIDEQIRRLKDRHDALTEKDLLCARQEADLFLEHLSASLDLSRTLVHVDMDMFYAAVEMRDNPELRDKPMAVGGMGMLSTSNYAARKFGVRAAMPGFIGKKLCPELVIVPTNMKKYAEVSEVIREVFREYDVNFSPMSLDEAYMDITDYLDLHPDTNPWDVVQEMRGKIEAKTQLTASAGIAPNTFLAKVCSDLNKPNGQFMLSPNQAEILEFVRKLSIRKAFGIGNVSEQHLNAIGVKTCEDLYLKRGEIKLLFSQISFESYMQISQGMGGNRLEPPEDRIRKSISTETTFKDTSDRDTLLDLCKELSAELSEDMKTKEILGQVVTVKIKTHDFKIRTKVRQLADPSNCKDTIYRAAKQILLYLLDSAEQQPLSLRLMGVRMSELKNRDEVRSRQRSIFTFFKPPTTEAVEEADRPAGPSSNTPTGPSVTLQRFTCPVCDEDFVGLNTLNLHLDTCCPAEKSEEDLGLQNPSNSVSGICADPLRINPSVQTKLNTLCSSDSSGGTLKCGNENPDDKSANLVVEVENENLTCPVCFSVSFSSEDKLNSHMDECLNKSEIENLLGPHESVVSSKRKLESTPSVHSKKPRLHSNKIDSYFRKS